MRTHGGLLKYPLHGTFNVLTHDPADLIAQLTFTCAVCGGDAGMVAIVGPRHPQSLSSAATLVRRGPEGGLEQLQIHEYTAARVAAALQSADAAKAVFGIRSPWMTSYCPTCDRCYCVRHWTIQGSDGWCANGHPRQMPTD